MDMLGDAAAMATLGAVVLTVVAFGARELVGLWRRR